MGKVPKSVAEALVYSANERTFLTYIRTSLAFEISAIGIFKFYDHISAYILAGILAIIGIIIIIVGIKSHYKYKRFHNEKYNNDDDPNIS